MNRAVVSRMPCIWRSVASSDRLAGARTRGVPDSERRRRRCPLPFGELPREAPDVAREHGDRTRGWPSFPRRLSLPAGCACDARADAIESAPWSAPAGRGRSAPLARALRAAFGSGASYAAPRSMLPDADRAERADRWPRTSRETRTGLQSSFSRSIPPGRVCGGVHDERTRGAVSRRVAAGSRGAPRCAPLDRGDGGCRAGLP